MVSMMKGMLMRYFLPFDQVSNLDFPTTDKCLSSAWPCHRSITSCWPLDLHFFQRIKKNVNIWSVLTTLAQPIYAVYRHIKCNRFINGSCEAGWWWGGGGWGGGVEIWYAAFNKCFLHLFFYSVKVNVLHW